MTLPWWMAGAMLGVAGLPQPGGLADLSTGKPVTATSYYNGTPQGDIGEEFPATGVTDGRLDDSGTSGNWSYWLTPNGQLGNVTIDLQNLATVQRFDLQNTHNRQVNDRACDAFAISLSTDGVNFTRVLTDKLADISRAPAPYPKESFSVEPTPARYVRFEMLSFRGLSGGINELTVFGRAGPAGSGLGLAGTGPVAPAAVYSGPVGGRPVLAGVAAGAPPAASAGNSGRMSDAETFLLAAALLLLIFALAYGVMRLAERRGVAGPPNG